MNNTTTILVSILAIILGSILIYFSIRVKYKGDNIFWNSIMRLRGVVGGLLFILLGVFMIINILKK